MKKLLLFLLASLIITAGLHAQGINRKTNLTEYEGIYIPEKKELSKVSISIKGDNLFLEAGDIKGVLVAAGDNGKFENKEKGCAVTFESGVAGKVEALLIAMPGTAEYKALKKKEKGLEEFEGEYYREDDENQSHLFITREGNFLYGESDGKRFLLTRIEGDKFDIPDLFAKIVFIRNKTDIIEGIKIIRGGGEITGRKMPKK